MDLLNELILSQPFPTDIYSENNAKAYTLNLVRVLHWIQRFGIVDSSGPYHMQSFTINFNGNYNEMYEGK